MEQKTNEFKFGNLPNNIVEMEKELLKEEKKEQEEKLKTIRDRNKKARSIIEKLSKPIEVEIDDIVFTLKPVSVYAWDMAHGNGDDKYTREDPEFQSTVVKECIVSPSLSDEEFKLLPAGLKYKLFMYLLRDFFSIAGKAIKKN